MVSGRGVAFGQIRSVMAWGVVSLLLVTPGACKEKTAYTPPPPPRVTVSKPVRQEVTDYVELTGNTQAANTVQLRARVQGYLEKVFFQDGQIVKKGQPLFQVEQDAYVAKLKQADVVGTGGMVRYSFGPPIANSVVRELDTFGVLKLTLHSGSYSWEFIPDAGEAFVDSGTASCVE